MMRAAWLNRWLKKTFPRSEPFAFGVNYNRQREADGYSRNHLVNIGWFVHSLPRLVWWCRVFGHRPVVDGTRAARRGSYTGTEHRWVRCGRCAGRGKPQGSLDPALWPIGYRYTGDWDVRPARERERVTAAVKRGEADPPRFAPPGPIGTAITGQIGGQLVIGGGYPGWGFEIKVGNRFSEHTLAASVSFGRLGAVYVHTEGFGLRLVTWLNQWGDTSKLIGVTIGEGRLRWKLWANRWHGHEECLRQPWWRYTDVDLRVVDRLLGPKRYSYTDVDLNGGDPVVRVVRMPERDYLVRLKLQRCTFGRKRQWRKRKQTWSVDWEALGAGIPFRTGNSWKGDDITGSGVEVSHQSVVKGTWASEAAAAIAVEMTKMRTRYGWDPIATLPLDRPRELV